MEPDKTERKSEPSEPTVATLGKPLLRDFDADGKDEGGAEGEKKAFSRPPTAKKAKR